MHSGAALTRKIIYRVMAVCGLLMLASCSFIFRKDEPSLSHVHIGHAITAWEPAPGSQGLLDAAELYGIEAKANSDLMLEAAEDGDIEGVKKHLSSIAKIVDPNLVTADLTDEYGLRRLQAESLVHLKVASEIFDASPNIRRTMAELNVKGQKILSNIDELEVFIQSAFESDNIRGLKIHAEEIANTIRKITGQPAGTAVYGIRQFRQDIGAMIAQEDPPYQTIDKYYLFSIGI